MKKKSINRLIHSISNLYIHIFADVKQNLIIIKIILTWGLGVLNSYCYSAIYMPQDV